MGKVRACTKAGRTETEQDRSFVIWWWNKWDTAIHTHNGYAVIFISFPSISQGLYNMTKISGLFRNAFILMSSFLFWKFTTPV